MTSQATAMSGAGTQTKSQRTFEFTKRKRWADILITGLTDVIVFVLSPEGKALYCGAVVTELLGWSETDILDLHLNDFIIGEDQALFQRSFEDSITANTELLVYVRLRCNPALNLGPSSPNDMLFEIKGYPHFVPEQGPECKCFFAMAKPYPSRNVAALNTFLDLQMENERLQQCLALLKARVGSEINPAGRTSSNSSSMYATSSLRHDNQYSNALGNPMSSASAAVYAPVVGGNDNGETSKTQSPENLEEGSRKKKFKKACNGVEQYVCRKCGRTDSPEWRKGPDGPKTLCNACGLRWAKQMRKFDEPSEETSSPSQPSSGPTTDSNA